MISIIQNFICTKDARLEIINNNISSLGDVFGEFEFFVNYGTNINLDKIHSLYKHHIPKLNFFNNLEKDWAKVTLALANEINTPYTIFLCEDMVVNASKDKIHKCINAFKIFILNLIFSFLFSSLEIIIASKT